MKEELQEQLKDIVVGQPETFQNQLKPILSNERLSLRIFTKTALEKKSKPCSGKCLQGKVL